MEGWGLEGSSRRDRVTPCLGARCLCAAINSFKKGRGRRAGIGLISVVCFGVRVFVSEG